MTGRSIIDIERELAVARSIDDKNRLAVESSDRPLVDSVFVASSHKRVRLLERELAEAALTDCQQRGRFTLVADE